MEKWTMPKYPPITYKEHSTWLYIKCWPWVWTILQADRRAQIMKEMQEQQEKKDEEDRLMEERRKMALKGLK